MPLVIQLAGSAIALAAFIATQAGWIAATSTPYLALNILGSAALVTSAIAERQWGFVVLEAVWGAVSAFGLYRSLTRHASQGDAAQHAAGISQVEGRETQPSGSHRRQR